MSKYVLAETVVQYHEIDIEDDLDIFNVLEEVNSKVNNGYDCCEALSKILEDYKEKYGWDYKILKNNCGSETVEIGLNY